jgi:hypothetical protein
VHSTVVLVKVEMSTVHGDSANSIEPIRVKLSGKDSPVITTFLVVSS